MKEERAGRRKRSDEDRAEGALHKAKGNMKEAAGRLTGDEVLKVEVRMDQMKGDAKDTKGKLKDLFK
jgi:uncharacterized protein YjbJ (UPF0337 family)